MPQFPTRQGVIEVINGLRLQSDFSGVGKIAIAHCKTKRYIRWDYPLYGRAPTMFQSKPYEDVWYTLPIPTGILGNIEDSFCVRNFFKCCCTQYGQANVNLATSYELALAGANVYIASFASLRSRVEHLQAYILRHTSHSSNNPIGSVIFRECKGFTPRSGAVAKREVTIDSVCHPCGILGALKSYSQLSAAWHPWDQEEHLMAIESCKEIIATTKPNLVVIDTMFSLAMDACDLLDQKFIGMNPNSVSEIAANRQPYFAALWKYPVLSSGYPYPLKWWQIPLNIYLHIRLSICQMTSPNMKQIQVLRRSLGIKSNIIDPLRRGVTLICPALAETDFPLAVIPKEICLCGPIVTPFDPLEESDPVLMKWLYNGPTVLISLGSHIVSNGENATEIAGAIRMLLDHHDRKGTKNMQVLWKAKPSGDTERVIEAMIGKEIREGRVNMLAWLDAEPVSILQHPNVVCTVHHGGANSFFEGIWSGIPQIVLPVWYETYRFANRVEFLNIGVFGSKKSAPGVRTEEFGKALVRVTGETQEAAMFKMAAQRLQEICRAKGNGRKLASLAILNQMGMRK